MGLYVCINEPFRELTHINVRHLIAETGVLHKFNLLALWRVDYPLSEGVSSDAEAIFPKLRDREKVRNPALVEPDFEYPEVTLHGSRSNACITFS